MSFAEIMVGVLIIAVTAVFAAAFDIRQSPRQVLGAILSIPEVLIWLILSWLGKLGLFKLGRLIKSKEWCRALLALALIYFGERGLYERALIQFDSVKVVRFAALNMLSEDLIIGKR